MANLSNFPQEIDSFIRHQDISPSDVLNINRFKELKTKTSLTSEEQTELQNLINLLRDKIFLPEDFNKLQDAMWNIENFTKDTITNYYQYKGNYDNAILYLTFNSVIYTDGNIYLALKDNQGIIPVDDGINWLQISQKGEKGDKGDPGIGLSFIGDYDNARAYNIDDAVRYDNKIYYCIKASIGNLPTDTIYWTVFLDQLNNASMISITDTEGNFTSDNVEGALQELFTFASDGKSEIATAITGMGQTASGSDTFSVLAGKVSDISNDADSLVGDVLSGKTFYQGGSKQTGTMANIGQQIITPSTTNKTISTGYHDGTGYVQGDADLISANIKSGKTIFGVAGNSNVVDTSAGTASASQILSGVKAYSDGSLITGTMINRGGATTVTPSTSTQTKYSGYYSGNITISGDADLVASNIRSGKNIFGVAGSLVEGRQFATGAASTTGWLTVTGLSFRPRYVVVKADNNFTANYPWYLAYFVDVKEVFAFAEPEMSGFKAGMISSTIYDCASFSANNITDDGFTHYANNEGTNRQYSWIAIGY